ncbi:MAG: hypothetical protein B7X93_12035 [Hydrogenophilales bacterium 17-61-9]|nr:MAG: hypothetical protein B7X93_12035 [Hydrogenophilales bacterium 17-61-9]
MPYVASMHTVVETEVFIRAASEIWSDAERISFINWLAMVYVKARFDNLPTSFSNRRGVRRGVTGAGSGLALTHPPKSAKSGVRSCINTSPRATLTSWRVP